MGPLTVAGATCFIFDSVCATFLSERASIFLVTACVPFEELVDFSDVLDLLEDLP